MTSARSSFNFCTLRSLTDVANTDNSKRHFDILQLPLDIFLLIVDELPWQARFMLMHTCRTARDILKEQWDRSFQSVGTHRRIELLALIADTSPDLMLCSGCYRLVEVDTEDTPRKPFGKN